jgi:hypothetical protein
MRKGKTQGSPYFGAFRHQGCISPFREHFIHDLEYIYDVGKGWLCDLVVVGLKLNFQSPEVCVTYLLQISLFC